MHISESFSDVNSHYFCNFTPPKRTVKITSTTKRMRKPHQRTFKLYYQPYSKIWHSERVKYKNYPCIIEIFGYCAPFIFTPPTNPIVEGSLLHFTPLRTVAAITIMNKYSSSLFQFPLFSPSVY